jgi:hypothetical protein
MTPVLPQPKGPRVASSVSTLDLSPAAAVRYQL